MRQVGDLAGQALAQRFLNYMLAQGVRGEAREESADTFRIWVYDEDELERCCEWFEAFSLNAADSRFDAPDQAPKASDDAAEKAAARPQVHFVRESDQDRVPVTTAMIAISVVVTFLSLYVPQAAPLMRSLHFSEQFGRSFPEILSGEVWRIFTPVFLHGNLWHILFNMMWLYQLGGAIERTEGSRYLVVLMLALAAFCDVAQYLVSGPAFIGMSGVVYGLLGYTWLMGRRAPRAGYVLNEQTFIFMIVWMVLCLVGIIPDVANTQHVVGLACGLLWALVRARQVGGNYRRKR